MMYNTARYTRAVFCHIGNACDQILQNTFFEFNHLWLNKQTCALIYNDNMLISHFYDQIGRLPITLLRRYQSPPPPAPPLLRLSRDFYVSIILCLLPTCACHTAGNGNPKEFTFSICRVRIEICNNRLAYDIITAIARTSVHWALQYCISLYRVTVWFFCAQTHMYHTSGNCSVEIPVYSFVSAQKLMPRAWNRKLVDLRYRLSFLVLLNLLTFQYCQIFFW